MIGRYGKPKLGTNFIRNLRLDNVTGMLFRNLLPGQSFWWLHVLHQNGITNVASAADAAKALEPLVQTSLRQASYPSLFLLRYYWSCLLGIPVLSGSAAYALSEALI